MSKLHTLIMHHPEEYAYCTERVRRIEVRRISANGASLCSGNFNLIMDVPRKVIRDGVVHRIYFPIPAVCTMTQAISHFTEHAEAAMLDIPRENPDIKATLPSHQLDSHADGYTD